MDPVWGFWINPVDPEDDPEDLLLLVDPEDLLLEDPEDLLLVDPEDPEDFLEDEEDLYIRVSRCLGL